jgi:hypothetical protein
MLAEERDLNKIDTRTRKRKSDREHDSKFYNSKSFERNSEYKNICTISKTNNNSCFEKNCAGYDPTILLWKRRDRVTIISGLDNSWTMSKDFGSNCTLSTWCEGTSLSSYRVRRNVVLETLPLLASIITAEKRTDGFESLGIVQSSDRRSSRKRKSEPAPKYRHMKEVTNFSESELESIVSSGYMECNSKDLETDITQLPPWML